MALRVNSGTATADDGLSATIQGALTGSAELASAISNAAKAMEGLAAMARQAQGSIASGIASAGQASTGAGASAGGGFSAGAARSAAGSAAANANDMARGGNSAANDVASGTEEAAKRVDALTRAFGELAAKMTGNDLFADLVSSAFDVADAFGGVSKIMGRLPAGAGLAAGAFAAVGVAAVAAYQAWSGYRESVMAVERANKMSAVSIGMTRSALEQQAAASADQANISIQQARAQQAAYIATGKIGGDVMGQLIGISRDYAAATGQDVGAVSGQLATLFSDPVKGAEELTAKMGLLDAAGLQNVRNLAAMGEAGKAQSVVLDALAARVKGSAGEYTALGSAMASVGNFFSDLSDSIGKGIDGLFFVRPDTTEDLQAAVDDAKAKIAELKLVMRDSPIPGLLKQPLAEAEKAKADAEAKLAAAQKQAEATRKAQQGQQDVHNANAIMRKLDPTIGQREELKTSISTLDNALKSGATIADRAAMVTALEQHQQAESSLMNEQQKAAKMAEAERQALNLSGLARAQLLARVKTEIEMSGQLLTTKQREAKIKEAVNAATDQATLATKESNKATNDNAKACNDNATALADKNKAAELAAAAALHLAEAAGKGAAAQRQATYENEQAAIGIDDVAARTKLLAEQKQRESTAIQELGNKRIGDMQNQIAANKAMAAAVLEGAEAVRVATRAEYQRAVTAELLSKNQDNQVEAEKKIAEVMATYDEEQKSKGELAGNTAIAEQNRLIREQASLRAVEEKYAGASNRERVLAIEHQKALNELAVIGVAWTETQRQTWLANKDAIAQTNQELAEQAEITKAAEGLADTFYNALTGKGDSITTWFKNQFKNIAKEALKQQILLPITTKIVQGMPELFGLGDKLGSKANISGIGDLLNGGGLAKAVNGLNGLLSGGSDGLMSGLSKLFDGGMSSGAASLKASLFGQAGVRGTATSGLFGSGGTAFGSVTAANGIAGGLAGIGTGMMAGQVLGMLGIGKGNKTGAAIGGALGGALGSVVPGIGTMLGSIAGGALGSLFGGKPSNKEGNAVLDLNASSYTVGGFTGKKFSQENRDTAAKLADQVLSVKDVLEKTLGAKISGTLAVGAGSRDGLFATSLNSTARTSFTADEAGSKKLVSFVAQEFANGIRDQLAPELSAALGRVDFSDLEKAGADLDFIGGFRKNLDALKSDFGLTDKAAAEAAEAVATQTAAIKDFRENAARLFPEAVGEADAALRQYVDGLVGVRDAAKPPTEIEQALSNLKAQWEAYIPLMLEVGYTTAEAQNQMAAGMQKAKDAVKTDWVAQMDREFNETTGNGFINQIRDLSTARDTQYRNADALGADRSIVDRNVGANLDKIITKDLGADKLNEIIRVFDKDFPKAADAARTALASLNGTVVATAQDAEKAAEINSGLDDREFALSAKDAPDAEIQSLQRKQQAERDAANAAGYTADQMTRLNNILAGELANAIDEVAKRAKAFNASLDDRIFAVGNDTNTRQGALDAYNRNADKEMLDAQKVPDADLDKLRRVQDLERASINKKFDEQSANLTLSLRDRAFAASQAVRPDPQAEIDVLKAKQKAERDAADAAKYTTEQMNLLNQALGDELTAAIKKAGEQAKAFNDSVEDRIFAATNDTNTRDGALKAYNRNADKEMLDAQNVPGADLAKLRQAQDLERANINKQFDDQSANLTLSLRDRAFAASQAVRPDPQAEIEMLKAKQQAERDAADAAKYTTEQMNLLNQALGDELTAAIKKVEDQAKSFNASIEDRIFAATNNADTREGALAAYKRSADKELEEAKKVPGADIGGLLQAQNLERGNINKKFDERDLSINNGLSDRAFALSVQGNPMADILTLQRKQQAELAAANAAGYTREQMDALAKVLDGEMASAMEQVKEKAEAFSQSLDDRAFAVTNDTSTLEGQLLAFDRNARKERVEAAKNAGYDLAKLEKVQGIERNAIIAKYNKQSLDALRQAGGQLRSWIDNMRATSGTPEQNVDVAQKQFDAQLALAKGGDLGAVQSIREYAERLINAKTGFTASGSDRRDMVNGILDQIEALPAVKSWDEQVLDALNGMKDGIDVDVDVAVIRTIEEALDALPESDREKLIQAQNVVRTIEEVLGRSLTDSELDQITENGEVTQTVEQLLDRPLTRSERAKLVAAGRIEQQVEQTLGRPLTDDEAALLLRPETVERTIEQRLLAAFGASLIGSGDFVRNIAQLAKALTGAPLEGDATINRTLAQVAQPPTGTLYLAESLTRTLNQTVEGGNLTDGQRLALLAKAEQLSRILNQSVTGNDLTTDQKLLLGAKTENLARTINQALTGNELTADQKLALAAVTATIARSINQNITTNGEVITATKLSENIALEIGRVAWEGQSIANRYLAAIAWNTAKVVGKSGGGLLITAAPETIPVASGGTASKESQPVLWEEGAAAKLTVDNQSVVDAINKGLGTNGEIYKWLSSSGEAIKINTAATATAVGGAYSVERDRKYLANNPDVADAVRRGVYATGYAHYLTFGKTENRPAYARGTDYHPGGWATVGEEGPELVNLPGGAKVFNRSETLELSRNSRRAVVAGNRSAGDGDKGLMAAMERQAKATERQNVLLEKIATASASGADAAAQTASVLNKPARATVGGVAKLRRQA